MQTKVGVHYHVRVGPRIARLYDFRAYEGPYFDIVLDDMDDAHLMLINLVNEHLPEYLDEADFEESYEHIEYMTDEVASGEMAAADMGVRECGFEFELLVCSKCVPKGMN